MDIPESTEQMDPTIETHEILRQSLNDPITRRVSKRTKKKISYKCKICSKEFSERSLLDEHSVSHSPCHPYECEKCPQKFKTKKALTKHFKVCHTAPTNHKCDVCGKMFHYMCKLKCHMLVHTGEKPYKCNECGKSFNSSYSLSTHNFIHKDEKPFKCSFCDYACRDSSTLRKHQERHMGIVKDYKCKLCDKSYKMKYLLKLHVAELHLDIDVRKHKCEECGKKFKNRRSLSIHIKTVHERSMECECSICGKTISNKSNLYIHMATHTDARPYSCDFQGCEKRFKDSSTLVKHKIIHYPERHLPCEICGRKFARESRLVRHLSVHIEKKKRVECAHCGVKFYSKNYLLKHLKAKHVDDVQKYMCDLCGFETTNKPGLIIHLKSHNGMQDTVCKICNTVFKRPIYLRLHYSRTHNIAFKMRRNKKKVTKKTEEEQDEQPETHATEDIKIKEEPIDSDSGPLIDLLDIEKEEIDAEGDEHNKTGLTEETSQEVQTSEQDKEIENENIIEARKLIALNSMQLRNVPENVFDDLFIQPMLRTEVIEAELDDITDPNSKTYVKMVVKNLIDKMEEQELTDKLKDGGARKRKKPKRLKRFKVGRETAEGDKRKRINEKNRDKDKKKVKKRSKENVGKIIIKKSFGKFTINTYECFVCFKIFQTKEQQLEHCKEHFDICSTTTLKKCPVCGHITKRSLTHHIKRKHKIDIKIPYGKIVEKASTDNASKYRYKLKDGPFEDIEIIPSVKHLNKQASLNFDGKNRKEKDHKIAKSKLVKKGKEWIVEREKIDINFQVIPEFTPDEIKTLNIDENNYLDKLKKLYKLAKKKRVPMMFPCDGCNKICQTLSALTLHRRRHDPDAKPFKAKVWKHKLDKLTTQLNKDKETVFEESVPDKEAIRNRDAKPKPIVNKHKCDPKLKDFYKNNIRGGDIEFWQFLKIFNKMGRENVNDFKDLESRTEFGLYNPELNKEIAVNTKEVRKQKSIRVKKAKDAFKRVIRLSKKEYERREEIRRKLRENIS